MRRLFHIAPFAFFLVIALVQSAIPATPMPRTALVIGNSAYKVGPLKNPVNDATDMAAKLNELGFNVTLLTDATQQQMEIAVREFGMRLRRGGVGLFYYAGHGVQVAGENYLVPVNALIQTESDVRYGSLNAGLVLAKMEEAGNGLNIVILDACRSNPFARSFRTADQGLAKMDAPTGSLIAYSTAPGTLSSDGSGRNGLYTKHLLTIMGTPDLPITELFMRVRQGVVLDTAKKQVPWESTSLIGEFHFASSNKTGASAPSSDATLISFHPSVAKPSNGTVDLSDISAGAMQRTRAEEEAKKEWDSRLKTMQIDFAKVQSFEQNPKYTPAERAKAWEKFLATYTDKNPFTDSDNMLRDKATVRKNYWGTVPQNNVKTSLSSQQYSAPTTPQSGPGRIWVDPVTGMEFVWIPGGTYEMGCGSWTNNCLANEKPAHTMHIEGFWLAKYTVTQKQWQDIMGYNPSNFKRGGNYPVENVSWNDAKAFISRLNNMGSAKFRLTTEAEWEYAARSGGKSEKYAGGDNYEPVAWYIRNSGGSTHPVGTKAANGLGLFDMNGNVYQWCEDVYSPYPAGTQTNPVLRGNEARVVRGGCWSTHPALLRTVFRGSSPPDRKSLCQGFRLVGIF